MFNPIKTQFSLFDKLRRLNCIKRCSLFPVIHQTSVAEHSFHVAMMAHLLAKVILDAGIEVDIHEVTARAMFHDVEECSISDIPWHVKRHLRSETEFDASCESFIKADLAEHSTYVSDRATQSCDGTLEWLIVKTCDIAELLIYCKEEYDSGNRHLVEMTQNCGIELGRLLGKVFSSINQQVEPGTRIMTDKGTKVSVHPLVRELHRLINFSKSFE